MNATLLSTGRPIDLAQVDNLEYSAGMVSPVWGTCGFVWLCPECQMEDKKHGCGKRFVLHQASEAPTYTLNMRNGASIPLCLPDYTMLKRLFFLRPFQVQRKRTAGWRMPENAVYVGRPTKWGNPYRVGKNAKGYFVYGEDGGKIGYYNHNKTYIASQAVQLYRELWERILADDPHALDELAGKKIACWCPIGSPCHRDPLIELANQPKPSKGNNNDYEF